MRLHYTSHTIQRQKTCVADEAQKPQTLRLCDCRPFLDAKNATQWSWLTFVGGSSDEARHSRGCQVYIYCSGPTHSITTKHQFNYRVLPASQYQFTKDTDYPFRSTPLIRMLFTRLLSIILRTAQWVFAAIVLGLSAYFVYQRSRYHVGPLGRLIFAIIWSSLSILFAVIWAIPTSSSITGYTSDFSECLDPPRWLEQLLTTVAQYLQPVGPLSSDSLLAGSTTAAVVVRGLGAVYPLAATTHAVNGALLRPSPSCP